MLQVIKQKFFNDWFPHWSPDIALRYLPIANDIKKDRSIDTIVDVASGSLGIGPYIRRPVIGVDVIFDSLSSPFLKKVKGNANNLPFKNKSFDASICTDGLEHFSKQRRKSVINELIRVAKKKIYVVVPCGNISEREDRKLFHYIKEIKQWEDPYLKEHIRYGLPTEEEILNYIPKNFHVDIRGLTNIYVRHFIVRFQLSETRLGRFISSIILILLIPLLLKINFAPSYRKLFLITRVK